MSTLNGFYDDGEVVEAKEILFRTVSNLPTKVDGLPRLKARREGTSKRRLDCEDILGLLEFVDKKQIQLPQFYAVNLNRVPRIMPSDVDAVRMAETVKELKHQVQSLSEQLNEFREMLADGLAGNKPLRSTTKPAGEPIVNPADDADIADATPSEQASTPTFVDLFQTKDEDGHWFVTKNNRKPKHVTRKVIAKGGSGAVAPRIKAVVTDKPKVWYTFIGRLDPATSADDVKAHLDDAGISVVSCSALPKTEQWHNKYSAFRVVVAYEHKDQMFEDHLWPAGTDIRDWRFSTRSSHGSR